MSLRPFGTLPSGETVDCVKICGGGLVANFLTYGAVLQDMRLNGHEASLVLGFDRLQAYLDYPGYFGAIAGRYANRIGNASFELDGKIIEVDRNYLGKHCLHGGSKAMSHRIWQIDAQSPDTVTMSITCEDGEMGFPGRLKTTATFSALSNGVLDIRLSATTDQTTVCNLAHHSYFNLDGSGSILGHELQVGATKFTPVDDDLIPTGEIKPVVGTVFDFTGGRRIGANRGEQIIDHNLCLSGEKLPIRKVANLVAEHSGVSMDIHTTEPGLQVYDGSYLAVSENGTNGAPFSTNSGLALEPQIWPDAPNQPTFPSAVLWPGETYHQHSRFVFRQNS